jgi:hypothetical protein
VPIANLIIAQAASAWIAAPFLVSLVLSQAAEGPGAYFFYAIAALAAVIVLIAGYIGSRLSDAIPSPTFVTLVATLAVALAAAWVSAVFIGPHANDSEAMGYLFTFAPVVAAITAFFLSATRRL